MTRAGREKRKEDYISEKEMFFDFLDEAMEMHVTIMDPDMIYRYINSAYYKNLDLTQNDIKPGDNIEDMRRMSIEKNILDKEAFEDKKLNFPKAYRSKNYQKFDRLLRFNDGRVMALRRKVLPNGYIVSVGHDVTDLIEVQKVLNAAMELGGAAYWIHNLKTGKTWLSEQTHNFMPENIREEVETGNMQACIYEEDRAAFNEVIQQTIETGDDKFSHTHRVYHKSGGFHWYEAHGEVIREDGEPIFVRGFIKDVHQQYLENEELKKARNEALAATVAKSQFLANMSHEIRTPLNGIVGIAQLLDQNPINDAQKKYTQLILKSSDALLRIVNDILDFSKIEAGSLDVETEEFCLNVVIEDVAQVMKHLAHKKHLRLMTQLAPGSELFVNADPNRVRQILTNLIGNSVKFTEKGFVKITSTRLSADKVEFRVYDTGVGIAEDKIDGIFEEFNQADNSITRQYGGTGLGLSICKKLAEMMSGEIKVASKQGVGTVFSVILPATQPKT